MNSSVFWDIMPCNLLEVSRRFRGTCCFLLQGWRVSQARKQHEAGNRALLVKQALQVLTKHYVSFSVDFTWHLKYRINMTPSYAVLMPSNKALTTDMEILNLNHGFWTLGVQFLFMRLCFISVTISGQVFVLVYWKRHIFIMWPLSDLKLDNRLLVQGVSKRAVQLWKSI
jgi:hypothetical protein